MRSLLSKKWLLGGLVLCSSMSSSFAADSMVYNFDGWKVTITPGRSATAETPAPSKPQVVPAHRVDPIEPNKTRINVRPISLTQEDPVPPAPMPDGVIPPLKATTEPTPLVPSAELPLIGEECCSPPIITPRMADVGANPSVIVPQTAMYRDIYFSIPFNRAEYNAYPSYRHDATMEFLFNQMRPTVIQRGSTNVYQYGMGGGYGYGSGLNYAYGPGYGYGPGFPQQYYPYNYGLRIHSSR